MDQGAIAEKLAAELRPLRILRYKELRAKVNNSSCGDQHDVVCDRCLTYYDEVVRQEFSPKCFLTTDIQIRNNEHMDQLDQDETNQWWMFNDPIAWAKVELDWDPRWYQIEPLRCTARKKVFRMGRQIGKTEILSILALYYLATHPDFRVVILCPYQDQVDLVFHRLRKYIQRSHTMSDTEFKIRDKMNPHEIEFYHPDGNSSVLGMTAGVRTGQKGDKYRGQTPSLLIIDEADMLDDETLESVLASLTGSGPIAQMVVSSTPTGRRAMYWKYCTNKRIDFREFHYTSFVSPYWTPELELFYRETYSSNGFAHEFMAEFGEMEVGLFQHKHIEACLQDYSLKGAVPFSNEMYTMGVDWNRRGIGVHVILTGYDFTTQKFRTAYKEVVDAGEFTQHTAIQRIAKLNEVWNPEFIYVDQGDGDTQVEALKLWGMQHPKTRLHRKVKAVNFGGKELIRDPLTKGFVKKAIKPFMVDVCVRRVESHEVILPRGEDTSTGLVGQMRDYSVVRYGRDGQPIFTDEKEHTLIAWMLSIYAVVMELSDIAKVNVSTRIAFTGYFGDGQTDLIAQNKDREFRDKQKRLTPLPRTFQTSTHNRNAMSFAEFMHVADRQASGGRGMRNRIGHLNRAGQSSGLSRPTWDRSRAASFRIPEDGD